MQNCLLQLIVATVVALTVWSGHWPTAAAQTPPVVPAPWQAIGVATMPLASPQLGLEFAEIVLPGLVEVHLRSQIQFTQKLVLFARPAGGAGAMVQVASFALSAKTGPEVTLSLQADTTQNLVLLAQTPGGWFMAERQLKVGRKP